LKILVLSFYYQPDLCAGSFRCTALIEQLKQRKGVHIEVITTLPNRYASFAAQAPEHEFVDGVEIHRVALPSHKSGMLDQIKAFTAFYRQAFKIAKSKEYDVVFATSSRLFTAFLGARIANQKKLPLYLDIRDIFVDTIKDILPAKVTWLAKPVFSIIEAYTFGRAQRINLVSQGFADYFTSRYPKAEYRWFTNGIDNEFLAVAPQAPSQPIESAKVTVLYAGNIGEGQGLHTIIPKLAASIGDNVHFRIIGDGGRKAILQQAISGLTNVELVPPVDRQRLISEYQNADILFLHLNDYPAFTKVLPSKIFEYAALGKPILAGVSGFAAKFLINEVSNAAVFYPGDAQQALLSYSQLTLNTTPRPEFIAKFARETIMQQMSDDIVSFGQGHVK